MNVYIIILIQQLIASGTHLFAKTVTQELSPVSLTFIRSLIAMCAWIILFFVREKKIKIERQDWKHIIWLSALAVPINQFLYLYGIKFTLASNGALLYAITPAIVLVASQFILGEKMSTPKVVGVTIAFSGVAIVMFERGIDFTSDYFYGNVMIFFAVIAWALYAIYGKKMVVKYGAFHISALTLIGGSLLFIPIGVVHLMLNGFPEISGIGWIGISYLSFGTSVVSYLLWFYALGKLDATRVTVFANSQPIFTTILAVIFLSQPVTLSFILGGLITIAGVVAAQRT